MAVAEHRFRVMACAAEVIVVDGDPALATEAEAALRHLEATWSRFVPSSDVSRLNAARGRAVVVAPETLVLVQTMVDAWHLTGGRFDPSMLPSLVANGYRTSRVDPRATTVLPDDARSGGDLDRIRIDAEASAVALPLGLTLDPGGLGKGLAADLVVARLLEQGAEGALVGVGGDLATAGRPPDPEGWLVAVADPWHPDTDLCELRVDGGAVATSSTLTCRWDLDGSPRHHVIDPITGAPADTDLVSATVVAATGWEAEALATATLLGGGAGALGFLDGHDVDGIAVTGTGHVLSTLVRPVPTAPAVSGAGR